MHYERWSWCGNFCFRFEFLLFMVTRYKLRNLSCNFFTDQEPETFIFFWSQLSHFLLFLYLRNFSYPHKHNVIPTAEVPTALGWPWDEHELPLTFLSLSGSPHCPFPTQLRRLRAAPSGKMAFPLVPRCNWKSDSHSIYTSASVLPVQGGLGTAAAPQGHRLLLSTFL